MYKNLLFEAVCISEAHIWRERMKGRADRRESEGRERTNRLYSALVPNSWVLCLCYNLIVHWWGSLQHGTIKNQQSGKAGKASISAVVNPFRSGFFFDILLLFFIIKIPGTLWGKCQVKGGEEMSESDLKEE